MKAIILNSGTGSRMGDMTKESPKCLTELRENETILRKQIEILKDRGNNLLVLSMMGMRRNNES